MMKKIKIYFLAWLILFGFNSCSNGTDTIEGETEPVDQVDAITMEQITSEGKSTIIIPLIIFGDSEDDVEGATFDVGINGGTSLSNQDALTYYSSASQAVKFVLSNLSDGDEMAFILTLSDGSTKTYSGTISSSGNSTATSSSE